MCPRGWKCTSAPRAVAEGSRQGPGSPRQRRPHGGQKELAAAPPCHPPRGPQHCACSQKARSPATGRHECHPWAGPAAGAPGPLQGRTVGAGVALGSTFRELSARTAKLRQTKEGNVRKSGGQLGNPHASRAIGTETRHSAEQPQVRARAGTTWGVRGSVPHRPQHSPHSRGLWFRPRLGRAARSV